MPDGRSTQDNETDSVLILIVTCLLVALMAVPVYRKLKKHCDAKRRRRMRVDRDRKDLDVIIGSDSEDEKSRPSINIKVNKVTIDFGKCEAPVVKGKKG